MNPPAFRILASAVAVIAVFAAAVQADDPELDRAISQHRMGTLTVLAKPGAEVRVEQLRHEFWFGAAISSGPFGRPANSPDTVTHGSPRLNSDRRALSGSALIRLTSSAHLPSLINMRRSASVTVFGLASASDANIENRHSL